MLRKMIFLVFSLLIFSTLVSCQSITRESKYITVNMVPKPQEFDGKKNKNNEYKSYLYNTTVKTENSDFNSAISSFSDYANRIIGVEFKTDDKADFVVVLDNKLEKGVYKINVGNTVKISASDETGINNAFATILQIMEKAEKGVYVPAVDIKDYADSQYRGMMVDLARSWHDYKYLLNYVDMCYFYKINVLHLHFTDSESYTLPSNVLPELTTENSSYTIEQINELVEYANARGVDIMPEIDVPGHCFQFQKKYPEIFGKGGVIHLHEEAMVKLELLVDELCVMFKYSTYIHIGGDEAAISNWTQCDDCLDYAETQGIVTQITDKKLLSEQMLAHFVTRMANRVFENNKKPIVWEGFSKDVNDMVSKDIIVMSWENYYQTTPDLLDAGFTVINCSWNPMYVVTPGARWPIEEVFDWTIYKWKPVHSSSPYIVGGLEIEPNDKVIGGQLLAWGDQIKSNYPNVEDGVKKELSLLIERITALSENTWNIEKTRTFDEFNDAASALNVKFGLE